jgi:pimeloyl-ACP methyl ester carboxylesterase
VLVGHSYGGAVITDAAVDDPEVQALVYVDAFIPAQGESIGALLARPQGAGSCIGGSPATVFNPVPFPGAPKGDVDLYLLPGKFPGCFASGLSASEAALLAATQRPLAANAATDVSGTPAWKTIPSWAVVGTADKVIPARAADLHGAPGPGPHHRRQRRPPIADLQRRRCCQRDHQGRPGDKPTIRR